VDSWSELDALVQWADKVGVHLLEDELIADAHSHPGRWGYDKSSEATTRGYAYLRAAAQADVVFDGDAEFTVGPDRPALVRHDDAAPSTVRIELVARRDDRENGGRVGLPSGHDSGESDPGLENGNNRGDD